jgi:hypothetical protein
MISKEIVLRIPFWTGCFNWYDILDAEIKSIIVGIGGYKNKKGKKKGGRRSSRPSSALSDTGTFLTISNILFIKSCYGKEILSQQYIFQNQKHLKPFPMFLI